MVTENDNPLSRLRDALEELRFAYPDTWAEQVVGQVGAVCQMDVGSLNLLADAATQGAALAHRMAMETEAEKPDESAN